MSKFAREAAKFVLIVAVIIAARPYFDFLVLPPEGQEMRWVITIIALSCAAAMIVYLRNSRVAESQAGDTMPAQRAGDV